MGEAALLALVQRTRFAPYKLQCSVTPIHRLLVEIFTVIFHIALEMGEPRIGLMHVYQHKIIGGISNV